MRSLVVIENVKRWPLDWPGAEVVAARDYVRDPRWGEARWATVTNMCRTYGYQTLGYYVSLLASARGQRAFPSIETLQDLRLDPIVRVVSGQLEDLVQRTFMHEESARVELPIAFDRTPEDHHARLARAVFDQFPAPLLKAVFRRGADGWWRLDAVRPQAAGEVPDGQVAHVKEAAAAYFRRPQRVSRPPEAPPAVYDLAILVNPDAAEPPSDAAALKRFVRAAARFGMRAELLHPDEITSVPQYDALFIRETTAVGHFTYRFARRAEAEGMVVIDDPRSIVRCTNKVYLAELFARVGVPAPKTRIVSRGAVDVPALVAELGLPCVVKEPDSSFSRGVTKAADAAELEQRLEAALARSELVLVQEFVASEYDWRIGILDGEAFYACRYHMAQGHWQIIRTLSTGARRSGRTDCLPLAEVPPEVVDAAVRAAAPIGDGLYGVDLKQLAGGRVVVVEVNDNPSVDAGFEDQLLGDALYERIMASFRRRLDRQRGLSTPGAAPREQSR